MAGPRPQPRLFPEEIPGGTAPRLLANTHLLQVQAGSQACSGGRLIDSRPEAPREALRPTHGARGRGNKAQAQGGPSVATECGLLLHELPAPSECTKCHVLPGQRRPRGVWGQAASPACSGSSHPLSSHPTSKLMHYLHPATGLRHVGTWIGLVAKFTYQLG